jgi:signal transduction histidine kinase
MDRAIDATVQQQRRLRRAGTSFFRLEELTDELRQSETAAYEKLIRMMSHEVNNSVGASSSLLQSSLAYGAQLSGADRADFERALQIAIDRMGQLKPALHAVLHDEADTGRASASRWCRRSCRTTASSSASTRRTDAVHDRYVAPDFNRVSPAGC